MKPSEVIGEITKVLNELAPVLDELLALIEAGSITPAVGQAKAVAALSDHMGKLGDGHLIQILIQNMPAIISIISMFFGGGGFHFPIPTPSPVPPVPVPHS